MSKRSQPPKERKSVKLQRTDKNPVIRSFRSIDGSHDVVFLVGDEKFPAHRIVVSAASPVLRSMMFNGMKESSQKEIVLRDFRRERWKVVLDFIYYEENVSISDATEGMKILECAKFYLLDDLVQIVEKAIESIIDKSNCCMLLMRAGEIGSEMLKRSAFTYVTTHFFNLWYHAVLPELNFTSMEEVVACDTLLIGSEVELLRAIISWWECDDDRSIEMAEKLAKHICIERMNVADLRLAGKIANDVKMSTFVERCSLALFDTKNLGTVVNTPIPPFLRLDHVRKSNLHSITHRFYHTNNWESGKDYNSPWMRHKVLGLRMRLRIRIESDERNEKHVGFYVHFSSRVLSERWLVQLFVHSLSRQKFHTIVKDAEESDGEHGVGIKKFISYTVLQSGEESFIEDTKSYSVVFGATCFLPERAPSLSQMADTFSIPTTKSTIG